MLMYRVLKVRHLMKNFVQLVLLDFPFTGNTL